jgi:putative oxidoreductase
LRADPLSKLLSPRAELAYAAMRVAVGLLFSFHGMQKVLGVMTEKTPALFSQIWIGGVIELVGGLLVAIGLFTVWAAFLSSGTMAVAYTQFHWKLQLGEQLLPAVNKGELALVYAFVFLFIACTGGGRYSVDARRG